MGLPLNLAMTPSEICTCASLPDHIAWMACHFSPYGEGLANIPRELPAGSMLILNDRLACGGHSPGLIAEQLSETVTRLGCESVLLDFQRPPDPKSEAIVGTILNMLPCPTAVTENYAKPYSCPVLLAPPMLHVELSSYLAPWKGREVWLEAALCQERIVVDRQGVAYRPQYPPELLEEGFPDPVLCCRYCTEMNEDSISFTLFDTKETLGEKLALAESLGVTRAVGLFQELGY